MKTASESRVLAEGAVVVALAFMVCFKAWIKERN